MATEQEPDSGELHLPAEDMGRLLVSCPYCSGKVVEGRKTFPVVKDSSVSVVLDVPVQECLKCGHQSYSQEVTKRLEFVASEHFVYFPTLIPALVYRWGDLLQLELSEE